MAIVSIEEIKEQLAFTDDLGNDDDAMIERKIEAAQNHIERLLGYSIEDTFGGAEQDPIPPALKEAVCQLAAWWYANREAAGPAAQEVPFGVREILAEYREFTF